MDSFLICAPSEIAWSISPEQFEQLLRTRWANVEVRHHNEPDRIYPVDVTVVEPGPAFIMGLKQDGSTLFVEGNLDQAISVALWWRKQVPPEEPLIFFDESYTAQVDLTPGSSTEELAAPFDGA